MLAPDKKHSAKTPLPTRILQCDLCRVWHSAKALPSVFGLLPSVLKRLSCVYLFRLVWRVQALCTRSSALAPVLTARYPSLAPSCYGWATAAVASTDEFPYSFGPHQTPASSVPPLSQIWPLDSTIEFVRVFIWSREVTELHGCGLCLNFPV